MKAKGRKHKGKIFKTYELKKGSYFGTIAPSKNKENVGGQEDESLWDMYGIGDATPKKQRGMQP